MLQNYAKSKGVSLVMHHETSAAPRTYDKQMDEAYALMQSLDIHVKSGYVGPLLPKGEYHHGQWMVNLPMQSKKQRITRWQSIRMNPSKEQVLNAHGPTG